MELIVLNDGMFDSKTYIVSDKKECAIIDCGVSYAQIISKIREKGLIIKYIILTHGHIDHILNAYDLKESTHAELCLHEDELELYTDPKKNASYLFKFKDAFRVPTPDRLLKNGDRLSLGDLSLEIIHTPGHSPGSISILCNNVLFSGDTLFSQSIGRTDFFGGNSNLIQKSIKESLYTLDENTVVYPGHGPSTTIGFEKENNPYV